MANLEVVFHIPQFIEDGLASGLFERVGGVIVERSSRQVVSWLRDSMISNAPTGLEAITGVSSGLLPANLIVNIAKTGATLYDGYQTRNTINLLRHSTDSLQQVVQATSALTAFTAAGQVLNLAVAVVSFQQIIRRLDRLSTEISGLGELVRKEFDRDRDMRFKVALNAARDVFESNNPHHRDRAIQSAIDGLYEARENFLTEFQQILNQNDPSKLILAQHWLIRAMYAELSLIRCYVEDKLELAKRRLSQEDLPRFKDYTQSLVKVWLGEHPAIFLHKQFSREDLDRFINLQYWLRSDDNLTSDVRVIVDILDDLRADFWNNEIVLREEYSDVFRQISRRPNKTLDDRVADYLKILTLIEILIENYQRLLGFDLELHSMRLSFHEWSHLIPDAELQKHGVGMIFDRDLLNELGIPLN